MKGKDGVGWGGEEDINGGRCRTRAMGERGEERKERWERGKDQRKVNER